MQVFWWIKLVDHPDWVEASVGLLMILGGWTLTWWAFVFTAVLWWPIVLIVDLYLARWEKRRTPSVGFDIFR